MRRDGPEGLLEHLSSWRGNHKLLGPISHSSSVTDLCKYAVAVVPSSNMKDQLEIVHSGSSL